MAGGSTSIASMGMFLAHWRWLSWLMACAGAPVLCGASAAQAACDLPVHGSSLADSCPDYGPHLRQWDGVPVDVLPLCTETRQAWRRCRLRQDGLLSPEQLSAAESVPSAVLGSRVYAALRAGGALEAAARDIGLKLAGVSPSPRLVLTAVPPLPDPARLPAWSGRPACLPPVVVDASGAISLQGTPIAAQRELRGRLWTILPALEARLPAADASCSVADIWASSAAPLDTLRPVLETLHRSGYRPRLLAQEAGREDMYARLVPLSLRVAPGGQAHHEALSVSVGDAIDVDAPGWSGVLSFSQEGGTVASLVSTAQKTDGAPIIWLSTLLPSLVPVAPEQLRGTLLLPGTPASHVVRASLDAGMPAYAACLEEALVRQPGLAGRVEAEVALGATGVTAVRFAHSEISDAGLLSCLWEHLSSANVTAAEPAVVSYSLDLRVR